MDAPTAEQPERQAPAPPPPDDVTRTTSELFRYSSWLHVGLGADECPDKEDGSCGNPLHFHAWCRLPNQFQHQEIRERALAAKARRIRQLKDPEADANTILESELDELARDRETMVNELVAKDWWKRHLQALADVEEQEEFEHADRDRARLNELQQLAEDKRPADEVAEIERHMEKFNAAVDTRRQELEQPVRDATEGLADDELVDAVRSDRIAAEGSAAFMDTYSKHQWFAGTYTTADPVERKRRFANVGQLEEAAPEVVEELRAVFAELETSLQRGPQGN